MRARGRTSGVTHALALGLVAAVLASLVLFAQTAGGNAECRYGGISAIGPVDAQGRGDTTPDVRCIEP